MTKTIKTNKRKRYEQMINKKINKTINNRYIQAIKQCNKIVNT